MTEGLRRLGLTLAVAWLAGVVGVVVGLTLAVFLFDPEGPPTTWADRFAAFLAYESVLWAPAVLGAAVVARSRLFGGPWWPLLVLTGPLAVEAVVLALHGGAAAAWLEPPAAAARGCAASVAVLLVLLLGWGGRKPRRPDDGVRV